ncbi:MAG: carboxylating nicotinate-nucleotide diphosphorylase [Marinifilaceae bacterium]|jgi:nicotinate-nucleotide pyrophosphorylase (carboxylating)|nr:carboxylating nicotinate-nucleotide diphosphorylase [Marinifilaceae bacterium]
MIEDKIDIEQVKLLIDIGLREDIGKSDITTDNLIPKDMVVKASMTAKQDGVIAGLFIGEIIFKSLDSEFVWEPLVKEGQKVQKGECLVRMEGKYRAMLTGERLALNFIQRCSGVATKTNDFVQEIKDYKTQILDTRKTLPAFRLLDKYSVKMGGGTNHRIGLYDMVMIKDNHIKVAGGITNAVNNIKSKIAASVKIEVECTTLEQVSEALNLPIDIIMLDNMSNETTLKAVKLIDGRVKTEASGNMNLQRLVEVAELGVDYISVGALTHSVNAMDISMNIEY